MVLNPVRAKTIRHPRQWKWSSYGATAGIVQPHRCLTVDEILSHFGQRKAYAQEKYSEFVQAGIGTPSIWDDLQAQSLLGDYEFAEGLRHLVTEKQWIPAKASGDRLITETVTALGL
jgi:putative transposase